MKAKRNLHVKSIINLIHFDRQPSHFYEYWAYSSIVPNKLHNGAQNKLNANERAFVGFPLIRLERSTFAKKWETTKTIIPTTNTQLHHLNDAPARQFRCRTSAISTDCGIWAFCIVSNCIYVTETKAFLNLNLNLMQMVIQLEHLFVAMVINFNHMDLMQHLQFGRQHTHKCTMCMDECRAGQRSSIV